MSRSRKAALNHREARPLLSWPDHVHNRICKRGVVAPIAHRLTTESTKPTFAEGDVTTGLWIWYNPHRRCSSELQHVRRETRDPSYTSPIVIARAS